MTPVFGVPGVTTVWRVPHFVSVTALSPLSAPRRVGVFPALFTDVLDSLWIVLMSL